MVPAEWAAKSFTKGLNFESSIASFRLKESLIELRPQRDIKYTFGTNLRFRLRMIIGESKVTPLECKMKQRLENPWHQREKLF